MGTFGSQTSTYNKLVAIFVAVGSMTYGYCSSIISSTIGQPGWYTYFDLPQEGEPGYASITTPAISTANGVFSAGGAVGTLFIMWSCDYFGRKVNIQLGAFFSMFGGALQGGANSLKMFQAGRFVCGLGIGILVTVCPMYLSEMSSAFRRGWLVGHHAIFLVFGYMLAGWVGYACYFAEGELGSFGWRFPLCLQCLPAIVLLLGSPWLPRSPRWLISKGKHEEAKIVLQKLRQSPDDPDNLVAKEEYFQTAEQIRLEAERLSTYGNVWNAVLRKKSYRKRMAIGFLTQWGAEFGGPLIINNYAVLLYTNLGMTGGMPLLLSAVWLTTAGVIYNPLGAWLHDKVNSRRGMYITGFVGIIISTSCLAAMTSEYAGTTNRVGNGFGIFFIYLYLAFQGTFCDTTMYLYVSEIFPTEIRPIGMGFSLFGQFAATLILLQTAPMGFNNAGWKYYLVIICWSAVFIPVIYYFFPETARLTLEEIAKNFGEEVAVHVTDATDEEKAQLERDLAAKSDSSEPAGSVKGVETGNKPFKQCLLSTPTKTPDPVKNAKGIHLITSLTPNGRKVHILLEELKDVYGLEWTTSLIDLDTKEQKKEWFLKLNPNGRIPILIDNTRSPPHPVMESSAELLYLVSSIDKDHQFWFSDPIEQSEAYQWLIFWHASGQPIQGQYNYFRRNTIDPHATTRFRDEVLRIYQVLEAHLSGKHSCNAREYLAGPGSGKYSIVDINAWAWIRTYRSIGFSEDEIAAWPSLGQWVDRIAERPAVQRGLGEWYDEDVHPELVVRTE